MYAHHGNNVPDACGLRFRRGVGRVIFNKLVHNSCAQALEELFQCLRCDLKKLWNKSKHEATSSGFP